MKKNHLHAFFTAVAGISFFIVYQQIFQRYPFYFTWDMDQTSTLDVLAIQSGLLPEHINHPSFGMYFIFQFTHKIAHWLQQISILNYQDLLHSLGAIMASAELLDFLRAHSSVIAILYVFGLWLSIHRFFSISGLQSFLVLIFLCTQSGIFFHVSMIRTEFYAVFYWAWAFFFLALFTQQHQNRLKVLYVFLSGLFLSLSYLTKLQALFYVLVFPLLLGLLSDTPWEKLVPERSSRSRWIHGALNLSFFLVILVGSYKVTPTGASFVKEYPFNVVGIIFLFTFFLMFASAFFHKRFSFIGKLDWGNFALSGFLGAYLLHFVVFPLQPLTGLKYLLVDAKMLFFRSNYQSAGVFQIRELVQHFWDMVTYQPALYLLNLLLAAALFPKLTREKKIFLFLVVVITYFNLAMGVRSALRDLVWAETLLNLLTLCFLFLNLQKYCFPYLKQISLMVLVALIGSNLFTIKDSIQRLDGDHNIYGWRLEKAYNNVYWNSHMIFINILADKYGNYLSPQRKIATEAALNYPKLKVDASFSFPFQQIDFRNTGIIAENLPVFFGNMKTRFQLIPDFLRGSILVDPMAADPTTRSFISGQVSAEWDGFNKFEPSHQTPGINVLPRKDLDVFVFGSKEILEKISSITGKSGFVADERLKITLSDEKSAKIVYGMHLNGYTRIPADILNERVFFAIRQKLMEIDPWN